MGQCYVFLTTLKLQYSENAGFEIRYDDKIKSEILLSEEHKEG